MFALLVHEAHAENYFIKKSSSGSDDKIVITFGDSFKNPSSTVSSTLSRFLAGQGANDDSLNLKLNAGDTLYIAKGTYTITSQITISMNNLKIYGGFSGSESSISLDERDLTTNPTILDGGGTSKILEFDCAGTEEARLDGFIFQNAYSDTSAGAIDITATGGTLSIASCIFRDNRAEYSGAGIYVGSTSSANDSQTITLNAATITISADNQEVNGQSAETLNQTVNLSASTKMDSGYVWTVEHSGEQDSIKSSITGESDQKAALTFSGTPNKPGDYAYTVKTSLKEFPDVSASIDVTLKIAQAAPESLALRVDGIGTMFDEGVENKLALAYTVTMTRKDGTSEQASDAAITWSAELPNGMSFRGDKLIIRNTTEPGTYEIYFEGKAEYSGLTASSNNRNTM